MRGPKRSGITAAVMAVTVVALTFSASPAEATGARPVVTIDHPEAGVIPAGEGCAFDVALQPDAKATRITTEFSDGRVSVVGNAYVTLTNVATGTSLVHHTTAANTFTPLGPNQLRWDGTGKLIASFLPGEQGPRGLVGASGALFSLTGYWRATIDLQTALSTSFVLVGTAVDLCAQLSH